MSLSMPILGLKPFVLVEFTADPDVPGDLTASVNAGGGITTPAEIRDALTLVLDSLPEPTPEESE
ncbi:hypothetical protein ACFWDN_21115 [Micromonospora chalcea]